MSFNSLEFTIFLPLIFLLYWSVNSKNIKAQNFLLLSASYIFYGWWDWRFLFLIAISSLVDFTIGIGLSLYNTSIKRKLLLLISIIVNIGLLCFFKYFNFFIESFTNAFAFFGNPIEISSLNLILPVGISFYTFQTLSYSIDVYRRKIQPTRDILSFLAFVSFFPQLVAGPIERAKNLLPQFHNKRVFNYNNAVDGMRQILWGLFKKIVIADNCAEFANIIFSNYSDMNSSTLLLGAIFFSFQIYGDFSGYSDIAIGTARLFGFSLMQNFAFPYFSRDIAEFWRKWHISLSTWFKDYIYIPLGGSKGNLLTQIRNVFIIFVVSGFWHGDNWTFVAWGFLNACYFLPLLLRKKNRRHIGNVAEGKLLPSFKEFIQMSITFILTVIAWVFFRADNLKHAILYLSGIFSFTLFEIPHFTGIYRAYITLMLVCVLVIIEWIGRDNLHALEAINRKYDPIVRHLYYLCIIVSIFWFCGDKQQFIYFQF